MPWYLKIAAKIILSRVPLSYATFARLGMFRHGQMADAEYGLSVVRGHMQRAGKDDLADLVCLELGPGDSLLSALIANAYGARAIHLVDAGAFAQTDMSIYRALADSLTAEGIAVDIGTSVNTQEMLSCLQANYATKGLSSLREIATDSVDFIWSQAVLEHIRFNEIDETFDELRRILKPNGISSHRVDLQDHLDNSLNNLRFSHHQWERDWFANSGFYTNRIRYTQMCERFINAGFEIVARNTTLFEAMPIARSKLDPEFADLSAEELRVRGFDLILK